MSLRIQEFTAICEHCGPAFFCHYAGKNDARDSVWCKTCGKKQTFLEAENYWFEQPVTSKKKTIFDLRKSKYG